MDKGEGFPNGPTQGGESSHSHIPIATAVAPQSEHGLSNEPPLNTALNTKAEAEPASTLAAVPKLDNSDIQASAAESNFAPIETDSTSTEELGISAANIPAGLENFTPKMIKDYLIGIAQRHKDQLEAFKMMSIHVDLSEYAKNYLTGILLVRDSLDPKLLKSLKETLLPESRGIFKKLFVGKPKTLEQLFAQSKGANMDNRMNMFTLGSKLVAERMKSLPAEYQEIMPARTPKSNMPMAQEISGMQRADGVAKPTWGDFSNLNTSLVALALIPPNHLKPVQDRLHTSMHATSNSPPVPNAV